jgi:hypothetical protein
MNTPLVQAIIAKGGKEYTKYWKDGSPMSRLGEPEDLRGIPAISQTYFRRDSIHGKRRKQIHDRNRTRR